MAGATMGVHGSYSTGLKWVRMSYFEWNVLCHDTPGPSFFGCKKDDTTWILPIFLLVLVVFLIGHQLVSEVSHSPDESSPEAFGNDKLFGPCFRPT